MNIAAFMAVLATYGIVLYLAQSSISRNKRNRHAYYLAVGLLAAGFYISIWLTSRMALSTDVSLAIILAFPALLIATVLSRFLFVAVWTGRILGRRWSFRFPSRRSIVYDKRINPHMYAFGVTSLSFLTFGPALLWLWVALSLGWK